MPDAPGTSPRVATARGYQTATEYATQVIRSHILDGNFPDGIALRQDDLANQMGLSRMPVREALRQLEAEGLVDFQPRRGAVVTSLSPDEVLEIYELRSIMEPYALALSIPNLDEIDFKRAEVLQQGIQNHPDPVQTGPINLEFHLALYAGARRDRTLSLISALHTNVDRYLRLLMSQLSYSAKSNDEHWRILDLSRKRDIAGACTLLRKHLLEGGVALADFVQGRQRK